jgi:hypothetical protein
MNRKISETAVARVGEGALPAAVLHPGVEGGKPR